MKFKRTAVAFCFVVVSCIGWAETRYGKLELKGGQSEEVTIHGILVYFVGTEEISSYNVDVAPGQTCTWDVEIDDQNCDRVEYWSQKIASKVGQSLIFNESGQGDYRLNTVLALGYAGNAVPVNRITVDGAYPLPDGAKTVWRGTDAELTASLYREGVDKVVSAVNSTAGASSGGASSGDPAADSDREVVATATKQANQLTDFTDLTPSVSKVGMESSGQDASSEVQALFPSQPSPLGYELSGGAPDLTITLPARFGGKTFDLNPFKAERFADVCSWIRQATAWATLVTLGVWCWSQMSEWVRGISTLPQAKGNPVVGGTGAQATALAAASMITAVTVVSITALVGWSFGDINFAAIINMATTNPMATVPAGVYWMLDHVVPVATVLSALVARLTFNLYAASVFAGTARAVSYIVP